jgi:hypothetical protein
MTDQTGDRVDEFMKLGDLPPSLIDSIRESLQFYTVAFIRTDVPVDETGLLGSGTLIRANGKYAILTADHVVQNLPKTDRLGLLLEKTPEPHTIDSRGTARVQIARASNSVTGPDLGAIVLAEPIGSSIAAKRSFYNLDTRRERMLTDRPDIRDGVWIAQGFLEERSHVLRADDGRGVTKRFYNFSGVGGPEPIDSDGRFDYFDFPVVDEEAKHDPASWGGMSGGGLWQIPLRRDGGRVVPQSPLLSGVAFFQHPTNERTCGIRCHGPASVYQMAYEAIARSAA